jgi:hypothetical protein
MDQSSQQVAMHSAWRFWLWRFFVTTSLAIWWGGLTFYAAVVVPLGVEQFGSSEQGSLTRRVTVRINAAGAMAGSCLLVDALCKKPRRLRVAMASGLLGLQFWLWVLHSRLSRLLDGATLTPNFTDVFYQEHRIYLWVTSAQWLLGLACLWCWWVAPPVESTGDPR